jgi:hypothetical protein
MSPLRRELLNGVFVLVLASLMSAVFAAFQVSFNVQLWVLILIGIGIAVSGYVMFEIALGYMSSTEEREKDWLKRVGTPARLELMQGDTTSGADAIRGTIESLAAGSDFTSIYYFGREGGGIGFDREAAAARGKVLASLLERQKNGTIREYKRIICFDPDVLVSDPDLKAGVLRVGQGPGTIDRGMGEHCRLMMETKGCSLYVAPTVLWASIILYGSDKASITVDPLGQAAGGRTSAMMFFYDPPNGEVIEKCRQIERETERRMVAVHKIRFPEDEAPTAGLANRSPA